MVVYVDNQSRTKWIKNKYGYQAKTRHVSMRYHFIREIYNDKILAVKFIPTEKQLADIFAKALASAKHQTINETIFLILSSGEC